MRNYAGSALMLFVTMAAAIGSYTVNLNVSAERAAVDDLRYRLVADARAMRNLQAELRTRARLPAMQAWNDNVLKMSAPAAGQFLRSPLELASFGAPAAAPAPALRYAVTGPESPVAPAAVAAPVRRADYAAPAAPPSGVVRASYSTDRAPPAPRRAAVPAAGLAADSLAILPEAAAAPIDLLSKEGQ